VLKFTMVLNLWYIMCWKSVLVFIPAKTLEVMRLRFISLFDLCLRLITNDTRWFPLAETNVFHLVHVIFWKLYNLVVSVIDVFFFFNFQKQHQISFKCCTKNPHNQICVETKNANDFDLNIFIWGAFIVKGVKD
jgi:hypothetical protein